MREILPNFSSLARGCGRKVESQSICFIPSLVENRKKKINKNVLTDVDLKIKINKEKSYIQNEQFLV